MATFTQGLLLALIVWELLAIYQTAAHTRAETTLSFCYFKHTLMSLRPMGTIPPADLPDNLKTHQAREGEEAEYSSVSGEEETDPLCPAHYSATLDR